MNEREFEEAAGLLAPWSTARGIRAGFCPLADLFRLASPCLNKNGMLCVAIFGITVF